MDLIRDLRAMTLASRLKRLGDRLKSEATRIYHANGIDFSDSWFLVAMVLSQRDHASVTEMAESLDVSHAAISQMAAAMERKGLVTSTPDDEDRRRSLLALTRKGKATVESLKPLWKAVGDCTDEIIDATGHDLLGAITQIEEQLTERSLFERVSTSIATKKQ